jgi:hypothetical protein
VLRSGTCKCVSVGSVVVGDWLPAVRVGFEREVGSVHARGAESSFELRHVGTADRVARSTRSRDRY